MLDAAEHSFAQARAGNTVDTRVKTPRIAVAVYNQGTVGGTPDRGAVRTGPTCGSGAKLPELRS